MKGECQNYENMSMSLGKSVHFDILGLQLVCGEPEPCDSCVAITILGQQHRQQPQLGGGE